MLELATHDFLDDKPFTHPGHNADDLRNLERLRHSLTQHLQTADGEDCQRQIEFVEEDGRAMRHIIVRSRTLHDAAQLMVVGFCGHKRAHLHRQQQEEIATVDADLVDELCQHPHMLAYCSIEIDGGDWQNLVLLDHGEGIAHWRDSQRHLWAVESLTPRFYENIRLHNGVLPHGLASERIVLTSTKYYDFTGETPWRAVRHTSA